MSKFDYDMNCSTTKAMGGWYIIEKLLSIGSMRGGCTSNIRYTPVEAHQARFALCLHGEVAVDPAPSYRKRPIATRFLEPPLAAHSLRWHPSGRPRRPVQCGSHQA
jgi:hypothetical protein